MTWTFSDSDISTNLAKVRVLIGDTDTTDQLLSDEIVNYFLTARASNLNLAAADACDAIASKFARKADFRNGALAVSASQRAKAYTAKAQELRERDGSLAEISIGGQSIDEKDSLGQDADAVQPRFARGDDSVFGDENRAYNRRWNRFGDW